MAHGVENIFLWENFLLVWKLSYRNIDRKWIIFTLKFRNLQGSSEQGKVYLSAFCSAISLCKQIYCMSKFYTGNMRIQSESPRYFLIPSFLSEICNFVPSNFFKPTMPLDRILRMHGHAHGHTLRFASVKGGSKKSTCFLLQDLSYYKPTFIFLAHFGTLYTRVNLQLQQLPT